MPMYIRGLSSVNSMMSPLGLFLTTLAILTTFELVEGNKTKSEICSKTEASSRPNCHKSTEANDGLQLSENDFKTKNLVKAARDVPGSTLFQTIMEMGNKFVASIPGQQLAQSVFGIGQKLVANLPGIPGKDVIMGLSGQISGETIALKLLGLVEKSVANLLEDETMKSIKKWGRWMLCAYVYCEDNPWFEFFGVKEMPVEQYNTSFYQLFLRGLWKKEEAENEDENEDEDEDENEDENTDEDKGK